jgi:hypothetical protein
MPNPIKPPFSEETAKKKSKWHKLILQILDGAAVQSSLLGEKLSYSFLSVNGLMNLITIL